MQTFVSILGHQKLRRSRVSVWNWPGMTGHAGAVHTRRREDGLWTQIPCRVWELLGQGIGLDVPGSTPPMPTGVPGFQHHNSFQLQLTHERKGTGVQPSVLSPVGENHSHIGGFHLHYELMLQKRQDKQMDRHKNILAVKCG